MKRRVAFVVIAAVTAAVIGASPALAQGPCGHGGRMLQRLDLNGDGGITPGEAGAVGAVRFLRLDTDGDGVVTEDEMLAVARERIAKKFARMDRNGDGRVERAEFDDRGAIRAAGRRWRRPSLAGGNPRLAA